MFQIIPLSPSSSSGQMLFLRCKKGEKKKGGIVIFLSVDLAAPASHEKCSEQGVGLTLELKQNVVNTVVCVPGQG